MATVDAPRRRPEEDAIARPLCLLLREMLDWTLLLLLLPPMLLWLLLLCIVGALFFSRSLDL